MPVGERRARSHGDGRAGLGLAAREWSTEELAVADAAIERFFRTLRREVDPACLHADIVASLRDDDS
jgi:hypothetical protein